MLLSQIGKRSNTPQKENQLISLSDQQSSRLVQQSSCCLEESATINYKKIDVKNLEQ